ncbi:TPR_MLP1_2 domain-containing protein, partial [Cephalotus follicularis]
YRSLSLCLSREHETQPSFSCICICIITQKEEWTMPLFISDDELSLIGHDPWAVAERADAYIRGLQSELDTVRAQADAASITAEQTCSLLEHKFISLSDEFSTVQAETKRLQSSLDHRLAELAEVQSNKHHLHLQSIGKDGEIERLTTEVSELHKSKRQLIELVEQKDLVISEKNATINSYLDKIVHLTDNGAHKESRFSEIETELARSQALYTRLSQEKELIERHNAWLNEELTVKVDSLIELRRKHADLEADMSAKLADVERQFSECSSNLKWNKERVRELEMKIESLQEELCSFKDAAAANEEQLSAELSTVNRLVELYKESSEEWSRKAGELEGVIRALETHSSQVENDYKERLEKEVSSRKQFEKEVADLKEKLERCESEIESIRKSNELNLLPLSSFTSQKSMDLLDSSGREDNHIIVPKIPVGVSGTALAASLLRDGWSLGKMYSKYQEAVDALRHEQLGRNEAEAILHRVLAELEEKAGVVLDERAEHERMIEAYSMINQKLQHSISEQANLEKTIHELKALTRRHERDYNLAQKEIVDLQHQVTILLKECRDIQLRCGSTGYDYTDDITISAAVELNAESDAENLTFRDINGLVGQNVQLRSLVRSLSNQIEIREMEFKEDFEMKLKKHAEDAASKVATVLQRAEEQGQMIESLHSSVAMYKRLYEEEHKLHLSWSHTADTAPEDRRNDLLLLVEGSQEANKKALEKSAERMRCLEEDLAKSRSENIFLRSERDKFALEANFAREKLESVMKEVEHQRNEINGVLARNVEFSQLIVDYQRKLRESAQSMNAAEEFSRKLSMEVSVLKLEKEMFSNAEKRACDEVRSLSERVHRLQASLDTIQSAEEVREEARAAERRKEEDYMKQVEREWADAKKQLQEERDTVRILTLDREQTLKNAMSQVEEMGKELSNALRALATAETRAAIAEAKLPDLEKKIKSADVKVIENEGVSGPSSFSTNVVAELHLTKEEFEKLKEEAQANKDHMLQYKSIAEVNETALKQMESAHESFKIEVEKLRKSLEAEILLLRDRVSELESESILKSKEVASAVVEKEEALAAAFSELTNLKEECAIKISQNVLMETQISALKEDLEKEHERWLAAQANYERQVVLQSETIQELTKTSQALASLQEEASELRKLVDTLKSENNELKVRWDGERSVLEESKNEAQKKYDEVNEQNKILHSRLEALHIQLAEKDRNAAGISSGSTIPEHGDSGLQNVINYLRRSKEIAETEISLLKQEKLRLQSQLESALKAAETAQASLNTERANSRALLFTDEEIKSLQLQVREMNLLRESNMQLREENKYNFEECQKLREVAHKARAEADKLDNLFREREIEVEACKKEIEMQRLEKEHLEKRICELLERCKNINVEDYGRLKNDVQQMEEKLTEKETQIEEMENLVSEKQETISQLEQDLANNRLVLSESEKRINDLLQVEVNSKADMEKQKRLVIQFKRRYDTSSKEKEDVIKENQALSKQLEDFKQGKRSMVDISSDQAVKEKEERDTRLQTLEKTIERQREELRKEKDDLRSEKAKRLNNERAIKDSVNNVKQERSKVSTELEKHNQALKRLSDELEKLKFAAGSLPQGTSVVQLLSGTILDDLGAAFMSAVENFERAAHLILGELGTGVLPSSDPSSVADTSQSATTAFHAETPITLSAGPATSHLPAKATEEKERSNLAKTSVETRKMGRKLVRPRLNRPGESRGDVEMSEAAPSSDPETQGNLNQTQPPLRKRLATSSASGQLEELLDQGENNCNDVAEPVSKKSKGPDSPPKDAGGANLASQAPVEESSDAVCDLPHCLNEAIDEKEEVEINEEKVEEPRKSDQLDGSNEVDLQNDNTALEETSDKPSGAEAEFDDGLHAKGEQEFRQLTMDSGSEREEGELVPEVADIDGSADMSNMIGSPEIAAHSELVASPVASPARVDNNSLVAAAIEFGDSSEVLNDVKNEECDATDETPEALDKSIEIDKLPEAALGASETASTSAVAETDVLNQGTSNLTVEVEEGKPVSPPSNSSTVVNLTERAKLRAALRQGGVIPPAPDRGRGRPVTRGRAVRGHSMRGGRGHGQAPGPQG